MGLLDDAIREHLDLKRRRGGDPEEIERLEREALGPVRRDPTADALSPSRDEFEPRQAESEFDEHEHGSFPSHEDELDQGFEDHPTELHSTAMVEEDESAEEAPSRRRGFLGRKRHRQEPEPDEDRSDREPEAFEYDDEDEASYEPSAQAEPPSLTFDSPPPPRPRFTPAADTPPVEDSPGDEQASEPRSPAGGRQPEPEAEDWDEESELFGEPEPPQAEEEPKAVEEEDPLDETPEFLQDTPDHDRLWFEQKPPRDFDFDG